MQVTLANDILSNSSQCRSGKQNVAPCYLKQKHLHCVSKCVATNRDHSAHRVYITEILSDFLRQIQCDNS